MLSLAKVRKSNFIPLPLLMFLSIIFISPKETSAATLGVPQNYSTIEAAYNAANNGDTILVAPGTYTVCLSNNRTKMITLRAEFLATTSPSSQHTVLNSGCSHVIQFSTPLTTDGNFLPGNHVEFIGFVLNGSDDGFSYERASGIVRDNIIQGQTDDPVDIDGPSEAHVIGNILRDGKGGGDGIENRLHSTGTTRVLKMIFRNNIIYKSRNDGIQFIDMTGTHTPRKYLIANNLIIANGQAGIGTTQGGSSTQTTTGYALPEQIYVLHNTFVGNAWGGIIGGANMKVHNNIFYQNGMVALKNVSGSSIASHNLFFGNAMDFQGSNVQSPNVMSDPKFMNMAVPPDFSSYQLGAGSPAINAGMNVSTMYQEFGVTLPSYNGAPDLGWKESGSSPGTPTPPSTPPSALPGDLDKDGDVDIFDYNIMLENFGKTNCGNIADINGNCKVDIFDYNTLLENFGKKS